MHALAGHGTLRTALAGANREHSLPSCLLLHGSPGVGKQRLALWLAQLVLCDGSGMDGPCGDCKSCKMCEKLEHPDLHWYFPLPRPKGASNPEKLKDALEDARFRRLREIREQPLRPSVAALNPTGLYLAVARSLRARAQRKPAMGARQVFLIGEAETLVPQEASQEAANALLKLLEEPPAGTHLILTSNQPGRLLDTIRSRTLPLYVAPLPRSDVRDFLVRVAGLEATEADRAAELACGSIGRALGFASDGDEKGALEKVRQSAFKLLKAATDHTAGPGYRHALGTSPAGARGLLALLEFVEIALRDLAAVAAGAPHAALSSDARDFLERVTRRHSLHPVYMAEALECVEEAKQMSAGNVNPQLILSGLTLDLRRTLLRGSRADARSLSQKGT
jgi:DNA polymerase III subunit delta'